MAWKTITDSNPLPVRFVGPEGAGSYTGMVATRTQIPNAILSGDLSLSGESYHIARDTISTIQLVVPNFYVRIYEATFVETALGADSTWAASVQNLRTGERTQMTWGGATTATVQDLTYGYTDTVTLRTPILRGDKFAVRLWVHNPVNPPYYTTDNCPPGDLIEVSGGASNDKTMGGNMADQIALGSLRPAAILSTTTRPSIYLLGDSRMAGYGDTMDSSLDVGEAARSVGPYFGYINAGIPGDRLQFYKTNSALRLQLTQFCSHVIGNLGGNDIIQGRSAPDIIADLNTVWALPGLAGRDISWLTIGPYTSSAGPVPASESVRQAVNAYIRSTPYPLARHFEMAELDEQYRDAGLDVDAYFSDAIHNNRYGYLHKQSAQRIRPELFAR